MKETLNITYAYLKKSKSYCLSVFLGISVSILLITSVMMLYNNFTNQMDAQKITNGTWLLREGANMETIQDIDKDESIHITDTVSIRDYGICKSDDDFYIEILAYNKFNELKPVPLSQGEYPKNDNEILISEDFQNAYQYNIGDSITETIGDRYSQDHELMNQGEAQPNEYFVKREEKTFTVSGVYENKEKSDSVVKDYLITKSNRESPFYDTYYAIDKVSEQQWQMLVKKYNNNNFKTSNGNMNIDSKNVYVEDTSIETTDILFYGIVFLVLGINMFLFTENIFQIYYQRKRKFMGQLLSIGMSRRQLMQMSLVEVLFFASIAIPLGILISMFTLYTVFTYLNYLALVYESAYFIPYQVVLYSRDVLWIVVVSFVLLMLSSFIPLHSLLKEAPIQLLTLSYPAKPSKHRVKHSWMQRPRSASAMLAKQMLYTEKKKYRSIKFTLIMSVILVLCSNYISQLMKVTMDDYGNTGLEVEMYSFHSVDDFDQLDTSMKELLSIEGMSEVSGAYYVLEMSNISVDKPLWKEHITEVDTGSSLVTLRAPMDDRQVPTTLSTTGHSALLIENFKTAEEEDIQIYKEELFQKKLMLTSSYLDGNGHFADMAIDFNIEGTIQGEDVGLRRDSLEYYGGTQLLVTKNTLKDIYKNVGSGNLQVLPKSSYLHVETKDKDALMDDLKKFQENYPYRILSIRDTQRSLSKLELMRTALSLAMTGFSLLTMIMAGVNLMNVLIADLLSKRKVYATLISLGMKHRQITQMLLVKTMTVVMSSLIWGIVLAEGITYGLGVLLHANEVYVNWLMMAGMFVIFFLLSGLAVVLGRRTLNDEECLQEILSDTD